MPLSKLATLESVLTNLGTAQELDVVLDDVVGVVRTVQQRLIAGGIEGETYHPMIRDVRTLMMAVEVSLNVLLEAIMIARSASADGTEQTNN